MSKRVESWRAEVERICDGYDADVVLALIAVESGGDAKAHRTGSQFFGLLQMGRLAGMDVGFPDMGKMTTHKLDGNGQLALASWHAYCEKYRNRHQYHPDLIALLWKAGPGYLRYVNDLVEAGTAFDDALVLAEKKYGYSAEEYLRRFRRHYHDMD